MEEVMYCYSEGVRGCIGKNPSPTLARDSAKIEYISGGQPSSYELAFVVELGPNSHFKTTGLGCSIFFWCFLLDQPAL